MHLYLLPLLIGFAANLLSAFTATFCRLWGERNGTFVTFVLRGVLGIPLWATGLFMAVHAPSPLLFGPTLPFAAAGVLLIAAGLYLLYQGFAAMRAQAMLPTLHDRLVQEGVYARLRHPMDAATILVFAGIVLMHPTRATTVACAIGLGWALLQAWVEERELLRRIPAYRAYMVQTARFIPRPLCQGRANHPNRAA